MNTRFDNMHQVSAFQTGKITPEEAKKFYSWYQVFALKSGEVSLEEALAFNNSNKFNLVRLANKTIKEAISCIDESITEGDLIAPTAQMAEEGVLFKYCYFL